MSNLKIYVLDMTWAGCIVVVAENMDQAIELMRKSGHTLCNWDVVKPLAIEEKEIVSGFTFYNNGDC